MINLEWLLQAENFVLDNIYLMRNPFLDKIFTFITSLGDGGFIWIFICIILLMFKKTRKCGITVALGLILNLIISNGILKNIFARTRPFDANSIKDILIALPKDFSFPSGHSSSSFVGATAVFLHFKKSGIFFLILASMIAFSRLYLYVHYPSDVVVGILIGIAIAFLSKYIIEKLYKN